ncbi:MAG: T9SS type A sorting domain-containing protein [Cyclobacteriaceae bacterium]
MRFIKLVLVVLMLSAFQLTMAQSQPDGPPGVTPEINLTRSVHLFPNPATEFVDVQLDQFPAGNVKLTVHNIIGNELQVETEILDEHLIRVKVKDLATGYYLLAIKDEDSKFRGTYKFLKR